MPSPTGAQSSPRLNRLRSLWANDGCAFGCIATIASVQTVQVLARSGLDFVLVDMEHGPIDVQSAHAGPDLQMPRRCRPLSEDELERQHLAGP